MGASLTMIDRHYGHLARDGREHAIQLSMRSTRPNSSRGRWWTLRGRRSAKSPSAPATDTAAEQAKAKVL
jgi:hypothetical protein